MRECNVIFQGGGALVVAECGAVRELEKRYTFNCLAGNSGGAIVAGLLASGYNSVEIWELINELDFDKFRDSTFWDNLGFFTGKAYSVVTDYGIYEGDYFTDWYSELLKAKGVEVFGDLKKDNGEYRLQVVATDLTTRQMLILPRQLKKLGYDPDNFSVARAVRMSISIPFFFEPVRLKDGRGRNRFVVDGGVSSNMPFFLVKGYDETMETFGIRLARAKMDYKAIDNVLDYALSNIDSAISALDNYYYMVNKHDIGRTIDVPVAVLKDGEVVNPKATDFELAQECSDQLWENGEVHARAFLKEWNFERWKKESKQLRKNHNLF